LTTARRLAGSPRMVSHTLCADPPMVDPKRTAVAAEAMPLEISSCSFGGLSRSRRCERCREERRMKPPKTASLGTAPTKIFAGVAETGSPKMRLAARRSRDQQRNDCGPGGDGFPPSLQYPMLPRSQVAMCLSSSSASTSLRHERDLISTYAADRQFSKMSTPYGEWVPLRWAEAANPDVNASCSRSEIA
jgi:hypothetical protein